MFPPLRNLRLSFPSKRTCLLLSTWCSILVQAEFLFESFQKTSGRQKQLVGLNTHFSLRGSHKAVGWERTMLGPWGFSWSDLVLWLPSTPYPKEARSRLLCVPPVLGAYSTPAFLLQSLSCAHAPSAAPAPEGTLFFTLYPIT